MEKKRAAECKLNIISELRHWPWLLIKTYKMMMMKKYDDTFL
jgi:hypothetical protein